MTDQEKRAISAMRKKGKGYSDIAKQLDIPLNTVKTFCRRNNLTGVKRIRSLSKSDHTNNLIDTNARGNRSDGDGISRSASSRKESPCRVTVSFAEESKGNILAEVLGLLMQESFSKQIGGHK